MKVGHVSCILQEIKEFLTSINNIVRRLKDRVIVLLKNILSHGNALRAPLGGGGQILPPCLTHERVTVAKWARRQTKALDEYILSNLNSLKVTCQVRSKVKIVTICLIGY